MSAIDDQSQARSTTEGSETSAVTPLYFDDDFNASISHCRIHAILFKQGWSRTPFLFRVITGPTRDTEPPMRVKE